MIQNQTAGSGDVVSVLTGHGNSKGSIVLDDPKKLTKQHHILSISISIIAGKTYSFYSAVRLIAWKNDDMSSGHSGRGTIINMVRDYFTSEDIDLEINYSAGTIDPTTGLFAQFPFSIVVYGPPIN